MDFFCTCGRINIVHPLPGKCWHCWKRALPRKTSDILRDVRDRVIVSTKPEPHPGHKAALLAKLEDDIAYFAQSEQG